MSLSVVASSLARHSIFARRLAGTYFSLVVVEFTIGIASRPRGDANRFERHEMALIYMPFFFVGIKWHRLTDANPDESPFFRFV